MIFWRDHPLSAWYVPLLTEHPAHTRASTHLTGQIWSETGKSFQGLAAIHGLYHIKIDLFPCRPEQEEHASVVIGNQKLRPRPGNMSFHQDTLLASS